jgi:hypothetical protein
MFGLKKFVHGLIGPSERELELETQVSNLRELLEDRDRQIRYHKSKPSFEMMAQWQVDKTLDKLANDAREEVLHKLRKLFTDRAFRVISLAMEEFPDRDGQRMVAGMAMSMEENVVHIRFELPKQGSLVRLAM